jgi:hypothetical protein
MARMLGEAFRTGGELVRMALYGGSPALLSMLGRPRRAAQYAASSLFLHRLASQWGLEQRRPQEILGVDADVEVGVCLAPQSWFYSWDPSFGMDLFWLCVITRLVQPRRVFEIGMSQGISALHFALNSPGEAQVFTLDLPRDGSVRPALSTTLMDREQIRERERSQPVFVSKPENRKITQLFSDSARFDFSDFRGNIDLFFVDGAHSYDYVRSDTGRALECCHAGSVVLWHDYGRYGVNGVTKYLHQLAKTREVYRLPGSAVAMHLIQ